GGGEGGWGGGGRGGRVAGEEAGERPRRGEGRWRGCGGGRGGGRRGAAEPFRTDVRILCATHRDLRQMIRDDQFREDLYFRINTFEVRLPPLRERREDVPELAVHLLARAARRPVEPAAGLLSPEARQALQDH